MKIDATIQTRDCPESSEQITSTRHYISLMFELPTDNHEQLRLPTDRQLTGEGPIEHPLGLFHPILKM